MPRYVIVFTRKQIELIALDLNFNKYGTINSGTAWIKADSDEAAANAVNTLEFLGIDAAVAEDAGDRSIVYAHAAMLESRKAASACQVFYAEQGFI